MDRHAVSLKEINYLFPLYLYPDAEGKKGKLFDEEQHWPAGKDGRVPNLSPEFVKAFTERVGLEFVSDGKGDLKKTVGPEDIFNYIYAVFHSPAYRARYAEFLKIDFPRIPLTSNLELLNRLASLGTELVALHLMESPALENTFTRFEVDGDNEVAKGYPRFVEKPPGRVFINKTQYFDNVPPEIWEFHVGGYQVCQKWLKDRRGRKLSYDDISHYLRIVKALSETIRLMAEIDAAIPEWPIG